MAERVRLREISNDGGNRLLKIVRRSSGLDRDVAKSPDRAVVRAGHGRPPIALLAFTSEDRVREVIHNFNADGFDSVNPKYSGGRPPKFTSEQRGQIEAPQV